ncbi:hypothetical protein FDUTEX481_06257 [Tolypothrix sp. PCC 7601]|nr:hypothetical protein FDUTEX481_06257 [Tolypothrix sp. PCC 7601]
MLVGRVQGHDLSKSLASYCSKGWPYNAQIPAENTDNSKVRSLSPQI